MHVYKYTNMQESKYERLKVCKFKSMWLYNLVSMPPFEYVIISYCNTQGQLENFSSAWNFAILQVGPQMAWFCKIQPFGVWKLSGAVTRITKGCLEGVCEIYGRCLYYAGKVSLSCWKVSEKFLIVSRMLPHSGPTWNFSLSWNLACLGHKSWAIKWIDY